MFVFEWKWMTVTINDKMGNINVKIKDREVLSDNFKMEYHFEKGDSNVIITTFSDYINEENKTKGKLTELILANKFLKSQYMLCGVSLALCEYFIENHIDKEKKPYFTVVPRFHTEENHLDIIFDNINPKLVNKVKIIAKLLNKKIKDWNETEDGPLYSVIIPSEMDKESIIIIFDDVITHGRTFKICLKEIRKSFQGEFYWIVISRAGSYKY